MIEAYLQVDEDIGGAGYLHLFGLVLVSLEFAVQLILLDLLREENGKRECAGYG